jgi:hypothetical protein
MRSSTVALILGGVALPALGAEIEPIGKFDWETDVIVGLSGLEVSEDGTEFWAVSDRGFWMWARFERMGEVITDVAINTISALKGENGYPVSARRIGDWSDAEGLAMAPDGRFWVSFERWAHVWRYDHGLGDTPKWIRDHPTFYDHAENWQLEAIAVSPDGTLYTFSEKPFPEGFPIYRQQGETWVIDGYLPESDLFGIVGADFDANGDLYILERKLVVGLWWQNRIRRVRLDGTLDEILWTGERGEYQNLEGISVWRDAHGLRLTLVSDNNGDRDDPTQFVEFRLTE